MRVLDVYRDQRLVGQLRSIEGATEFEYASSFLAENPEPVSASLPLGQPYIRDARAANYFGNLLPEGDLRTLVSQNYKVDAADDVGLLSKIGAECAGALAIVPEARFPPAEDAPFEDRYLPIAGVEEFGERINAWATSPIAAFKGQRTKLSLAGAQSKTAIARFDGEAIYVSTEGAATTHIVKFGSKLDNRGRETYPGIVYNEYFCSRLARRCGIDILPVELLPYVTYRGGTQEHVFCIQRYDRLVDLYHYADARRHRVDRLHQEDFCQALGRSRNQKYEETGGITLAEMFRFCSDPDQVAVPAVARRALLNLLIFNLLIGNRDSHAKNYSLLRSGHKAALAPAYDLVCTQVYEDTDQSLPQRVGGAETFETIESSHLGVLAGEIGIAPSALIKSIGGIAKRIAGALPALRREIGNGPYAERARPVVEPVCAAIGANIDSLAKRL